MSSDISSGRGDSVEHFALGTHDVGRVAHERQWVSLEALLRQGYGGYPLTETIRVLQHFQRRVRYVVEHAEAEVPSQLEYNLLPEAKHQHLA